MLKITVLAVGFLTIAMIAPARSTNFQIEREARHQGGRTPSTIKGNLYAEKILPAKKSVKLAPTAIKTTFAPVPVDRKPEPSPANKELKPVKDWNQQEFEDRNRFRSNDRPINVWDNSANGKILSGFGNFRNFNR